MPKVKIVVCDIIVEMDDSKLSQDELNSRALGLVVQLIPHRISLMSEIGSEDGGNGEQPPQVQKDIRTPDTIHNSIYR